MTGGVLGGGVIFVVAALLWGAVLVPAWMRRREFRAAERNALRLQRTLRVLAETAEVPQEVRLEATAKQALAQEKLLRTAQRRQEAERDAELAAARAEQVRAEIRAQEMRRRQAAAQRSARLRKPLVRRARAVAALVALGGVVGVLVGAGFAVGGNGPAVLGWSAALAALGTGALVLLAPGRMRVQPITAERLIAAEPVRVPETPVAEDQAVADEVDDAAAAAAHAEVQQQAAERIERARALARARAVRPAARENQTDSILLREAREQVARARAAEEAPATGAPAVAAAAAAAPAATAPVARETQVARRTQASAERERQQASRDRLSRMGVIGDTSEGMPDLDAALRRRRNVG